MGLVVCVWVCRQCLGSLVVGWWFSVMVFSGSVGDGGSRRWWGFCLGLPAVMGFVFGFAGSDGVSGFDPWLQTKWGLPAVFGFAGCGLVVFGDGFFRICW
uniref:Uncharacterized protein n=1 Tax=Fagus sylvatica TaxID=28930 RepID=A0A2N9HHU3_FAGSY